MIPPFLFRCLETGLETERGKDEGKEKRRDKVVKLIDDRTEGGRETNITATEEHKSDSDTLQTVMRIRRTDEHEEEKVTFTFTFRAFSTAVSRVTYSQYICHKRETTTSPSMQQNELKIITAICQRFFKCISAVIEVRRYGRTSAYILYFLFVWGWEGQGEVSTNESCVFF